ncbi:hypothetical protein [Nonomuraea turcica]|uniref:hypothetical protein n=1 Tax=Nonomuraea sp. G32 TaxID=3067274 RepID=UPI00273B8320|nr:hypothetical protein [Nonomuraea sp. G32]MDP4504018.1 hypothetical protein [Nonomuraea sp. G32]
MADEPLGKIVIARQRSGWRDRSRAYTVLIDGAQVGSLRRGGVLEIDVSPGQHVVQLKIDWTGSAPHNITVPPASEVNMIACSGKAWRALIDMITGAEWCTLQVIEDRPPR